ncbi:MAG: transketolase [Clostridia bacterium]|nr:transketolase [Clostridia bacterium]
MDIIQKTNNYLKSLTAETISNAKSGHTGSAVSASTMLLALFHDHLKFNPNKNDYLNRDRFVLSAGHTSALLYSLLHLFGYDVSINDLKTFRKCGSKTPGHPEYGVVPGVETTTGPLGQGIANAVGMALAESIFESTFNEKKLTLFDNYTYCYSGDGCLMEGVGVEACSLAGTWGLNKLILLYDDNNITIDGARTLANNENAALKFEAMGWNVIEVKNGHDYNACTKAIAKAKASANKPTVIIFKTIIGIGTSKEGTCGSHAFPLPAEELASFKAALEATESFFVPEDVYSFCKEAVIKNQKYYDEWKLLIENLKKSNPDKIKLLKSYLVGKPANYEKILKELLAEPDLAGRDISHYVLNKLAPNYPGLIGGTADVAPSTKAFVKAETYYSKDNKSGKNIHFGIREHSMGSICNGIALYLQTPAYDSTFMAFSNYMIPPIRMRSMMNIPVLSVFTHDSIDIGEDGPTHQPIEQIGTLRQIIGLTTFRPATKVEVVAGYKYFLENKVPVSLVVSKSKLLSGSAEQLELAERGGYVIHQTGNKPEIQIISTGADVALAISVANALNAQSRVISMPCEKLFDAQDNKYKKQVLLDKAKLTVVIEASNDSIWFKYANKNDLIVGVNDYQTSGSGKDVYAKAGFTAEAIVKKIQKLIK